MYYSVLCISIAKQIIQFRPVPSKQIGEIAAVGPLLENNKDNRALGD